MTVSRATRLLGLWKGASKGGKSVFETLDGAFTVRGGVANLDRMDLDGARARIETRGQVNLPEWTLSTTHKIKSL